MANLADTPVAEGIADARWTLLATSLGFAIV
jgi:hypothetical protein